MRTANLLLDINELAKLNSENNANLALVDMFDAYEKAKDKGDHVFYHPDFWTFIGSWNDTFSAIFDDYETARLHLPWLDPNIFQNILNVAFSLSTTSEKAVSLENLEREFVEGNNGILCCSKNLDKHYVFDLMSWYELHCHYIQKYPEHIKWSKNAVFCNIEYSDFCIVEVVDDYNKNYQKKLTKIDFNTELIRTFRNDKNRLSKLAFEIARRNAYVYDDKLSKSEKRRRKTQISNVFKIKKDNVFQYLSLDTENGQFEVCNKKGEHIGVWNFSGIKTANADETGKHNIKL